MLQSTHRGGGQTVATHAQVKHLCYEVEMLAKTMDRLRGTIWSDQTALNTFIESFCVHARNLNEFFMESGRPDTLKASSFTDAKYRRPRRTKRRTSLFKKVQKQIAHLTMKRTAMIRRKIGMRQMWSMYKILIADLRRFDRHLRPALRRKWRITFS
jgi:hypothetical protein